MFFATAGCSGSFLSFLAVLNQVVRDIRHSSRNYVMFVGMYLLVFSWSMPLPAVIEALRRKPVDAMQLRYASIHQSPRASSHLIFSYGL